MNNTNPFIYSDDNKRYHTLNYYNKSSFNSKVFKAVIDAGFTCPNKDGTKGTGGCIYCMGGSGYFTEKSDGEIYDSVKRQLAAEKERIYTKHPDSLIQPTFRQIPTHTHLSQRLKRHTLRRLISEYTEFQSAQGPTAFPMMLLPCSVTLTARPTLPLSLACRQYTINQHKSSTDATPMTSFWRATVNCKNPAYAPAFI